MASLSFTLSSRRLSPADKLKFSTGIPFLRAILCFIEAISLVLSTLSNVILFPLY